MKKYFYNLRIAFEAVLINKIRSMLTALGIIFGVAAVIAMLGIGKGAQKEILDQIKLVGVNNIIITPKSLDNQDINESEEDQGSGSAKKFAPGLSLQDAKSIAEILPAVKYVSPEVIYETYILKGGKRTFTKLIGITPDFFSVFNIGLERGYMFNTEQMEMGKPVCLIGQKIKSRFFPQEDPMGKYIKCGGVWLKVIGVIENRMVTENATENLGINDYNSSIFAPIKTLLLRYTDRSLITKSMLQEGGESVVVADDAVVSFSSSSGGSGSVNNQIDKIVIQVESSEFLDGARNILFRMMKRRHQNEENFEIKVPELLLKQEQRTKDIFNIVLGAIASISLIVGGIGIMNIMLASVMERIREIGVRRAIGARKKDIIVQFVAEAMLISIVGGIFGIVLGVALAKVITQVADILTIISVWSVILSFGVSASVGIIFGFMPARKAAEQDPVTSLRHE